MGSIRRVVDEGAAGVPGPMLITRKVGIGELAALRGLLDEAGLSLSTCAELVSTGSVLVLVEVTADRGPALAVAALELVALQRTALVRGLAVAPGFRRRGLGRRLVEATIALLQADGYEHLVASASPASPAGAFLRACGFGSVAATPRPEAGGGSGSGGSVGECLPYVREL